MKAIIITVGVLLIALITLLIFMLTLTSGLNSFYDEEVTKLNYNEIQITDVPKGQTNLYYFYQENCHYCNEIKPTMRKYNDIFMEDPKVNLYFVDIGVDENRDAWAKEDQVINNDLDSYKKYGDIKISGTPTIIEVTDGKVASYESGTTGVVNTLKKANGEEVNES